MADEVKAILKELENILTKSKKRNYLMNILKFLVRDIGSEAKV